MTDMATDVDCDWLVGGWTASCKIACRSVPTMTDMATDVDCDWLQKRLSTILTLCTAKLT